MISIQGASYSVYLQSYLIRPKWLRVHFAAGYGPLRSPYSNLTFFQDQPFFDPEHARGATAGELLVVRRDQECAPFAGQPAEQISELRAPG